MSTKPMKPIGGAKQPQQEIDINDTETIVCDECGNATFIQCFFLRRISPLMSPTGQEAMVPIQVYSCGNCGHINRKLNPTLEQDEENNNEKENFI